MRVFSSGSVDTHATGNSLENQENQEGIFSFLHYDFMCNSGETGFSCSFQNLDGNIYPFLRELVGSACFSSYKKTAEKYVKPFPFFFVFEPISLHFFRF